MNIPFVDLHTQYLNIKDEIDSAIGSVISETAFIGGSYSKKFEGEFAAKLGVKHCETLYRSCKWNGCYLYSIENDGGKGRR
jgi:dTDP-4-amino-4,6-dideoxygalactose transaminase